MLWFIVVGVDSVNSHWGTPVPCPGETQATMEKNRNYLVDIQPDFVVTLPIATIAGWLYFKGMLYELDLLKRPEECPVPPYKTNVNGEFVNPFLATGRTDTSEEVLMNIFSVYPKNWIKMENR